MSSSLVETYKQFPVLLNGQNKEQPVKDDQLYRFLNDMASSASDILDGVHAFFDDNMDRPHGKISEADELGMTAMPSLLLYIKNNAGKVAAEKRQDFQKKLTETTVACFGRVMDRVFWQMRLRQDPYAPVSDWMLTLQEVARLSPEAKAAAVESQELFWHGFEKQAKSNKGIRGVTLFCSESELAALAVYTLPEVLDTAMACIGQIQDLRSSNGVYVKDSASLALAEQIIADKKNNREGVSSLLPLAVEAKGTDEVGSSEAMKVVRMIDFAMKEVCRREAQKETAHDLLVKLDSVFAELATPQAKTGRSRAHACAPEVAVGLFDVIVRTAAVVEPTDPKTVLMRSIMTCCEYLEVEAIRHPSRDPSILALRSMQARAFATTRSRLSQ